MKTIRIISYCKNAKNVSYFNRHPVQCVLFCDWLSAFISRRDRKDSQTTGRPDSRSIYTRTHSLTHTQLS